MSKQEGAQQAGNSNWAGSAGHGSGRAAGRHQANTANPPQRTANMPARALQIGRVVAGACTWLSIPSKLSPEASHDTTAQQAGSTCYIACSIACASSRAHRQTPNPAHVLSTRASTRGMPGPSRALACAHHGWRAGRHQCISAEHGGGGFVTPLHLLRAKAMYKMQACICRPVFLCTKCLRQRLAACSSIRVLASCTSRAACATPSLARRKTAISATFCMGQQLDISCAEGDAVGAEQSDFICDSAVQGNPIGGPSARHPSPSIHGNQPKRRPTHPQRAAGHLAGTSAGAPLEADAPPHVDRSQHLGAAHGLDGGTMAAYMGTCCMFELSRLTLPNANQYRLSSRRAAPQVQACMRS